MVQQLQSCFVSFRGNFVVLQHEFVSYFADRFDYCQEWMCLQVPLIPNNVVGMTVYMGVYKTACICTLRMFSLRQRWWQVVHCCSGCPLAVCMQCTPSLVDTVCKRLGHVVPVTLPIGQRDCGLVSTFVYQECCISRLSRHPMMCRDVLPCGPVLYCTIWMPELHLVTQC